MRRVPLVQRECIHEMGGDFKMESAKELHIEALINEELERIIQEHGLFASDHEAWAVIKEELEEVQEDYLQAKTWHNVWWQRIRADDIDNLDAVDEIEKYAIESIKELVQVAACCRKYRSGRLNEWVKKQVKRVGGNHSDVG